MTTETKPRLSISEALDRLAADGAEVLVSKTWGGEGGNVFFIEKLPVGRVVERDKGWVPEIGTGAHRWECTHAYATADKAKSAMLFIENQILAGGYSWDGDDILLGLASVGYLRELEGGRWRAVLGIEGAILLDEAFDTAEDASDGLTAAGAGLLSAECLEIGAHIRADLDASGRGPLGVRRA